MIVYSASSFTCLIFISVNPVPTVDLLMPYLKTSTPTVRIAWLCFPSVFFSLLPRFFLSLPFLLLILLAPLLFPFPFFYSLPFLCLLLSSYSPPPPCSFSSLLALLRAASDYIILTFTIL